MIYRLAKQEGAMIRTMLYNYRSLKKCYQSDPGMVIFTGYQVILNKMVKIIFKTNININTYTLKQGGKIHLRC